MSETGVIVLFQGYSTMKNPYEMRANCSCVLIKGEHKIIVDTMTPWDSDKIITGVFGEFNKKKLHFINITIITTGFVYFQL